MFKFLKTAALTTLIAASALTGVVVPASAQSGVYLGLGGGRTGPDVGVYIGEDGRSYRRHDRRHERRDDRYERRDRYERACSPGQALNKAERMGIRRARVVDVGRRSIEVAGRSRGDRVVISFGRAPGCPVFG